MQFGQTVSQPRGFRLPGFRQTGIYLNSFRLNCFRLNKFRLNCFCPAGFSLRGFRGRTVLFIMLYKQFGYAVAVPVSF